jgi:hypothetical protein
VSGNVTPTGSEVEVVGFLEEHDGLLDGAAGPGEATLVDRVLLASGIDRFPQAHDGEIGQLLADPLEASPDLVEFTGHDLSLPDGVCNRDVTTNVSLLPADA